MKVFLKRKIILFVDPMLKIKYIVVFQSCSICLRPIMFLMIIASLRLQKNTQEKCINI